jgi:hypothetical protein
MYIEKEIIYMIIGYILCLISGYIIMEYEEWRKKKSMKKEVKKTDIWLVIKNKDKGFTFTKYFDTEFEKDKYKRKLKHISYLRLIEDSTDINYNNS